MTDSFKNRHDAGRFLAQQLQHYAQHDDVIVLALPRGGVPVAYEVAASLQVRMDVFVVRKLGAPFQPELALGAIASGGAVVLNDALIERLGITPQYLEPVIVEEQRELQRREQLYRPGRPPVAAEGQTVILVDDGLATGASMRAATLALRKLGPARIVVAVPVGAEETCREFASEADEVVCGRTPRELRAVGMWYEDFTQTTDEEVAALLQSLQQRQAQATVHVG